VRLDLSARRCRRAHPDGPVRFQTGPLALPVGRGQPVHPNEIPAARPAVVRLGHRGQMSVEAAHPAAALAAEPHRPVRRPILAGSGCPDASA